MTNETNVLGFVAVDESAGVVAAFVSQPSDTILVEVNDQVGAEINILNTVRISSGGLEIGL